jgi:small-conductance mechanosensitive channel
LAVALGADLNKAIEIIQDEARKHRYFIDNRSENDRARGEYDVMVRVMTFLDSGIQLRAYVWTRNPNDAFDLKCDLNKSIKERFDQAGIVLSNLHHLVVMKNL